VDRRPLSHPACVICTTCGNSNPSHVIFCEECGQRLAPKLATPTPPQGLSSSEPQESARAARPADAVRDGRHALSPVPQRPAAPEIHFSRRGDAPPADDRPACPLCGSRNQRGLRFCVTCGHLLAQPSMAREATVDTGASTETSPPRIAPMRVVELTDTPIAARSRVCPRCQGVCEGPAQYCRFCGGSLADAPIPLRPSSLPSARSPSDRPTAPPPNATSAASAASAFGPQPAPAAGRPRLVLLARDGGEGPSFAVGEVSDIGRSEGSIVLAEDRYVSPRHARIALREGSYFLRDLGSTNGVFLRIPFVAGGASGSEEGLNSEQPLGDQELFLVGQQVLRFEVVKHAEEGFGVASENGTLLFGTPAAPRYARLTLRTVEGVARDVFHLRKTETIIGRELGDIVFTDDPFLSRRHAAVRVYASASNERGPHRFTLADLGSSNGTFLQIREEVRLRHGAHFRVGQQLFRFDTNLGA
jgi:pSer/pThr/pTyr-binding forkhead associated (FHA) protein